MWQQNASMTLGQDKIAAKIVFGQLMKSEYRLWINNILMLNILSFDSCTVVIKQNYKC